jgi:hypothetical protein
MLVFDDLVQISADRVRIGPAGQSSQKSFKRSAAGAV